MCPPVTSPGMRSGVNWSRRKWRPRSVASAFTSSVLPSPGRPSSRTCPRARQPTSTRRVSSACPSSVRSRPSRMRSAPLRAASTSAGESSASFVPAVPVLMPRLSFLLLPASEEALHRVAMVRRHAPLPGRPAGRGLRLDQATRLCLRLDRGRGRADADDRGRFRIEPLRRVELLGLELIGPSGRLAAEVERRVAAPARHAAVPGNPHHAPGVELASALSCPARLLAVLVAHVVRIELEVGEVDELAAGAELELAQLREVDQPALAELRQTLVEHAFQLLRERRELGGRELHSLRQAERPRRERV